LAVVATFPAAFTASHLYTPSSSGNASVIFKVQVSPSFSIWKYFEGLIGFPALLQLICGTGFPDILHLKATDCPSLTDCGFRGSMSVGFCSFGEAGPAFDGVFREAGACITQAASHRASPALLIATHSYAPESSGRASMMSSVKLLSSSTVLKRMSGITCRPKYIVASM